MYIYTLSNINNIKTMKTTKTGVKKPRINQKDSSGYGSFIS
jgi:hypothetical protein